MATYICSDIHGEYNKYIEMLSKIEFNENDNLYIIGDVIDRKEGGLEIVDHIRQYNNIHLIKGNHERRLVDFYKGMYDEFPIQKNPWFKADGLITYNKLQEKDDKYIEELVEYLDKLPTVVNLGKYILVHGGFYNSDRDYTLEEALNNTSEDKRLWNREFFLSDIKVKDYTVVLGHTPTYTLGHDKIMHKPGKILIDCGCCYGKYLACLKLDEMKEFYI
ncbi:serine/threonine protein phosphatase [Romboutsia hominis]|uniref:Serine/threonine protein phosphatase n=1 Tax=Romboutsia faecis TaxID=2764597 RepID=A0ABR7JPK8_9FIRM|nr:metallophosphoesterase [Romboutsia faecis]MBC5996859.1 serine/threonine protein phosphatase [Romboutsia faecis]